MSKLPIIEPQSYYGLKTGIKGNATFITDSKILYPVGGVLALHDYSDQRQQYIPLPEKKNVPNIICVSPDKKLVAISEVGDKPLISLFDLATLTRLKGLVIPFDTITAKEFVSLGFTCDGKYIIAIAGDPDWMLLCYEWETGKVDSSVKANNPNHPGPITQVCCNPSDNAVVCVIGPGLFRLLNVSESMWRQFGWQKAEMFPMTCTTWLSFDRVISGTKDGRIVLVESGELKAIYRVLDIVEVDMKIREDAPPVTADIRLLRVNPEALAQGLEVRELITFKKGFACACGSGTVYLFEKQPKSDFKYRKRNVYKIVANEFRDEPTDDLNVVQNLSLNISENALIATTQRSQIYSVKLWGPDIKQVAETRFKLVGEELHHGPVIGLAMCPWKPIFVTVGGLDRTVRLWNYETETQDMIKQYQEDIYCVALHPTGLFVLIGFSEQLRLMILLIDNIQECRAFQIRHCYECSFSTNGHLFAAVNGLNIEVYSTVSYELMYNLKGHNGKIGSLKWSPTDSRLVSCSSEGAIYEWEVATGNRVGEVVTKTCRYADVALLGDGKTYGVGSDGRIKEIKDSTVVRGIDLLGKPLDCIVLSRSDQMMFVAGANGSVLSVNFPIIEKAVFKEYNMHDNTITKMIMSYDDKTIVTASGDGTICVWKLTFTDDKEVTMDKEFKHSTEILISKKDLKDKVSTIKDLTARTMELETEHEYELRQIETLHSSKLHELNSSFSQALEELRDKNQEMLIEQRHEVNMLNSEMNKTKERHDQTVQNIEADYNAKLMVEYEKFKAVADRLQAMRPDYDRKLDELEALKQHELNEMKINYEQQLKEKNDLIQELQEDSRMEMIEHEATKKQIEEDGDREIIDHKAHYEDRLREGQANNVKLRGDIGIMKKRFISYQQDIDEYKRQVQTAQAEQQKSQLTIVLLERDIVDLKKEVNERDVTIADKEKKIGDLKKKIQELDKFKFVLGYKITELENKLQPKEREITDKKHQIREMEAEFESGHKTNLLLQRQVKETREKLSATESLLAMERTKNRENASLIHRMRTDLDQASNVIHEPNKLKEAVMSLHQRYSKGEPITNHEVTSDFERQREHLERTVNALKRQVSKQATSKVSDRDRIVKENIVLLAELNGLRTQLQETNEKISSFEMLAGETLFKAGKITNRHAAKKRLETVFKTHDEIHQQYATRLNDTDKKINALTEEIQRLTRRLQANEKQEERGRKTVRVQSTKSP